MVVVRGVDDVGCGGVDRCGDDVVRWRGMAAAVVLAVMGWPEVGRRCGDDVVRWRGIAAAVVLAVMGWPDVGRR
ncbi:hypothetical protein Tco_0140997 [Tanacetum coccineum]